MQNYIKMVKMKAKCCVFCRKCGFFLSWRSMPNNMFKYSVQWFFYCTFAYILFECIFCWWI